MRIKSFIAILIGMIAIGISGILALNHRNTEAAFMEKYAVAQLQNATEQISLNLSLHLEGAFNNLKSVSNILALQDEKGWNEDKLRSTLKAAGTQMQYEEMNICGTDGMGFDLSGNIRKTAFCSYYQRALLGDSTIAFTYFNEGDKEPKAVFTIPVYRGDKIIGVLRAALNREALPKLMTISTFRGNENVYLVKRNGLVLISLAGDMPSSGSFFDILDERKRDDPIRAELEQVVKQGRTLLTGAKIKGKDCYISTNGIKSSNDWDIIITIPRDKLLSLYQDTNGVKRNNYTAGLLAVVVAMVVMLVILNIFEIVRRYKTERLAFYDEVTDSINYNRFRQDAAALISKAPDNHFAIVQLGIDKFDYIKEFFGLEEGNRILLYITKVLNEIIKTDELFCRASTDHFILLLHYHNKDELTNRISFLDSKLCNFEVNEVKNNKYEFLLHYGIHLMEDDKKNMDIDLMAGKAEQALLLVKDDRKQLFSFYSDSIQKTIVDAKEIEDRMFQAIEEKEFLVYLQPKFELSTGRQAGAEALVRWMHPEKGLIYPGRFIKVFEKNGFIARLDMYMLETLCSRLKVWISKGYRPMPISINMSRLNLYNDNFEANVINTVERYGIPPNLIQLEMAEKDISDNMERVSSLMLKLREYGFLICMDNFGTGTASMNTLYNVPINELKLDRKFLLRTEKTDRGQRVIQSIIEMAKRLNIKVVSEGVESKDQARTLQELGCDMIQGFVFAEPLPLGEYENYAYGPRAYENVL